jgi:Glyoxalase-like domain
VLVDHLIYAAPHLVRAVDDGPQTYLEIIAPDPQQPGPSIPRPFGLDTATHGRLVGWAIACNDIDGAVAEARRDGYDPGKVTHGQRVGPTGTVLQWRAAGNEVAHGLVPFLICWGDTEHPSVSAPRGLILESLEIEHPDPASLLPLLTALDADVAVKPAAVPGLVAYLSSPNGSKVLR